MVITYSLSSRSEPPKLVYLLYNFHLCTQLVTSNFFSIFCTDIVSAVSFEISTRVRILLLNHTNFRL
jgi:hypothetical protein